MKLRNIGGCVGSPGTPGIGRMLPGLRSVVEVSPIGVDLLAMSIDSRREGLVSSAQGGRSAAYAAERNAVVRIMKWLLRIIVRILTQNRRSLWGGPRNMLRIVAFGRACCKANFEARDIGGRYPSDPCHPIETLTG